MRLFLIPFFLFSFCVNCFSDTAFLRKLDGYPIEYQSGDVPLDIFLKNNPQYTSDQVIIKKMTFIDYKALTYKMVDKPILDKKFLDAAIAIQPAIDALKAKGFTDTDISNFKKVLQN